MPALQWKLHGLAFLDVTRNAMQQVSWGYPINPRKVMIHIDGATSEGPAGWANIILIEDKDLNL